MTQPYLTDRTRIQKQQQCPRSRYYHSEINDLGIAPAGTSVALSKGLATHKGVESLNNQVKLIQQSGEIGNGIDITLAVNAALKYFDECIAKGELEVEEGTAEPYVYAEQRALIEFAVRGYAISRLPYHISTFEIVEVEKEYLLQLAEGLVMMGRGDGEERRMDTGRLYNYEFKTSFAWDSPNAKKRTIEDDYRVGMQGLATLIQMEAAAGEEVHGINMEFFINGSRREDSKDHIYKQDTWTIRPWVKRNVTGPDQYAWQYYYVGRDGQNHSIGNSYKRVNIWELMEIEEWIDMLSNMRIQPDLGDPLSKVFIAPVPYQRNSEDIRSFLTSIIKQELAVVDALEKVKNAASRTEYEQLLDEYFPKYTHSCINKYRKYCPFFIICHGELMGMKDPRESGLFKDREPHHDAEKVMVGGDE